MCARLSGPRARLAEDGKKSAKACVFSRGAKVFRRPAWFVLLTAGFHSEKIVRRGLLCVHFSSKALDGSSHCRVC